MDPTTAADVVEIIGVTSRYCFAIDGHDWEALRRDVFTADATFDFGPSLGVKTDVEGIIEVISGALAPLDGSHHLVGSHVVDVDGDTARCRCYLHAQHIRRGLQGGPHLVVGATYTDELVRTEAGWRIRHRTISPLWREGNPEVTRRDR